jgi:hypothetical protein
MALKSIYCSSCGLEILPDEPFIFLKNNDLYHTEPKICYAYRDVGWF